MLVSSVVILASYYTTTRYSFTATPTPSGPIGWQIVIVITLFTNAWRVVGKVPTIFFENPVERVFSSIAM